MASEELQLEAARFTSISALVREIIALLECTDYHFAVVIPDLPSFRERFGIEIEPLRLLGRVRIVKDRRELKDSEAL